MAENLKWFEDPQELRRIRRRFGLSQLALAKSAEIKRSLIADVELGRRRFTKDLQERIWPVLTAIEREQRIAHPGTIRLSALSGSGFDSQDDLQNAAAKQKLAEATEKLLPLTLQRVAELERVIKTQQELIGIYRGMAKELIGQGEELQKSLKDKELRLKELRELLGLETEAALVKNAADELREKIKKPVTAPEGGE